MRTSGTGSGGIEGGISYVERRGEPGSRHLGHRVDDHSAVELAVAVLSGSVGLLGDAPHNLSDVSTSLVVFKGLRFSRRPGPPKTMASTEPPQLRDLEASRLAVRTLR